jgi:methylmalonyl-CoA mutase N-terminal domain/subunit
LREAQKINDESKRLGCMAKAFASGLPKLRIEEVSRPSSRPRIDHGKDFIVVENK